MAPVSAPIPTTEPARIIAGDTAKWLTTLPDYPASDGWVMTVTLVSAAQRYTATATASGDDHLVTIDASTTTNWVAGDYALRAQVALGGEVYTVRDVPRVVVAPAYSAAIDSRSTAATALDNVEAVIEGRASSNVAEYQINGRSLRYLSVPELLQLRDRLRADVAREAAASRAAAGLAPAGRIAVRWGA
ncbi:MAG: hypothetical protein RL375_2566 [Pseudomonadota bacterium]